MGRRFLDNPYPPLLVQDFGPASPYRVAVHHAGRTVAIGDCADLGFQKTPTYVQPGPHAVDVVIHGLPGRFIDQLGGRREIPAAVVALLLESVGVPRRTPLRLLTCHAAEAPLTGPPAAQQLATEWGGPVSAANGLLRIAAAAMRIDLVDWDPDPVLGGMSPTNIRQGQGSWVLLTP